MLMVEHGFGPHCFLQEELEKPKGLVLVFHHQLKKHHHFMEALLVLWNRKIPVSGCLQAGLEQRAGGTGGRYGIAHTCLGVTDVA